MPQVHQYHGMSGQEPTSPPHQPLACSLDRGSSLPQFPPQHPQYRAAPTSDVQLSLSQDDLRRLLQAADYAQRERAFLLQTLEELSLSEKHSLAMPEAHPQSPDNRPAPLLVRDEGGLFRVAPSIPVARCGNMLTAMEASGSDDVESDHFRMFRFKVEICKEVRCHDWAQCPFAHPGEKAARRDPRVFRYSASPCPDVKRSGKCARGDSCSMAHGVFECWLHPSRYRTQPCKDGLSCRRTVCFFAHSNQQLRLAPAAAAASAADAAAESGRASSREDSFLNSTAGLTPLRESYELLPGTMTPDRSTSPSSILSPGISSPPPSPPHRTASLTRSTKVVPCADYIHCSPPRFFAEQQRLRPIAAFCPHQQSYGAAGRGLNEPMASFMLPSQQQQDYCLPYNNSFAAGAHIRASPQWTTNNAPVEFNHSTGSPWTSQCSFVCDEEPDLTWVSELIQ